MQEQLVSSADIDHDVQHPEDDTIKKVVVTVDNKKHEVRPGVYIVSEFKRLVKVNPQYELEEIINGQLTPLNDNAQITIKGGEVFVSHARQGGSSSNEL